MMQKISKKELLAELDEHNDFFDMIVDMVPAKIYGEVGQSSDEQPLNKKYHKKASEAAPQKMTRKAAKKEAKRRKLDPAIAESTSEPQIQEQELKEESTSSKKGSKKNKSDSPLPVAAGQGEEKKESKKPEATHTSRIEALKAKLQAKIAEKQGGRPDLQPDQVSKRAARRAEKRKRQEEAKQRAQKKSSSATTTTLPKFQLAGSNPTPAQDLAQMDFGRLTGLNAKDLDPTQKSKEILQNLTKPKNLHKMLADAESKHQKMEQLKQGDEKDKEKLATMQWKDTFKEADGTRIKDDPNKLKKALKRKVAKKAKSQKAWQSRTEQVSAATKERQNIRQHNLNTRKQGGKAAANLSRKEIRKPEAAEGEKTGRKSRPGFEGRKQGFLNNDKKKTGGTKGGDKKKHQ